MSGFEITSFDKIDSAGTPRSGLFFKFCRLFGKDKIGNFVHVFSEDEDSPNKGELTNIIDGNASTVYESGKENCSIILYFPNHKLKIIKYSLTSEGKPTDMEQMRNWTLEGTTNNIEWELLDNREKVNDIQGIARSQVYDIKNNNFFKAFKLSSINRITLSSIEFFGYAEVDSNKIDFSNRPIKKEKLTETTQSKDTVNNTNRINQQLLNRLSQIYASGPKPPANDAEINSKSTPSTNNNENDSEINIILKSSNMDQPTSDSEDSELKNSSSVNENDDDNDDDLEPNSDKKVLSTSNKSQEQSKDECNLQSSSKDSNIIPNIESDIFIYKYPPKIVAREEKPKEEEEKVEQPKEEEESPKKNDVSPEDLLPLPKPELNSTDKHWMSISLTCNNPSDFYNGIFKMMKSRFSRPSSTTGFVEIFADTKKQMPLSVHNLVDCMKGTDWYSTKKDNPSITLYFPFHLLTINAIGFRSHVDKHFGRHFLKKFNIYLISDENCIVNYGSFETNKLNDFEAKATYRLDVHSPIRAIRITSTCGKFGLSFIELYGTGTYNEIQTQFSKDFLTNPSLYSKQCAVKQYRDYDNPHKSIKKKLVKKVKKMLDSNNDDDYIKEWSDHSDEDEENEKKKKEVKKVKPQPKPKPIVVEKKRKEITIDSIEAIDPRGPSIIQEFEHIVDDSISLEKESKDNMSICSYMVKQQPNKSTGEIFFFFTNLKIKLTGIKIRTADEKSDLPKGFNLCGHCHNKESKHEEWRNIFSSPREKLQPNKDYYYPIESNEEYTDFLLVSYSYIFTIDFIDFYGTAKVIKQERRNSKEIEIIRKRSVITYEDPPVISVLSRAKPGIFERMVKYYGTMLLGFVQICSNRKKVIVTTSFLNESFSSLNESNPGIILYFPQHEVLITEIEITSTENSKCLKRFFITNENNVLLADIDYEFGPNQKRSFTLDHIMVKRYQYLKIFSLSGTFECKNVELYGSFNPSSQYYKIFDKNQKNWNNSLFVEMKNKEINAAFEKERKSAKPQNPKILFSVDIESYKDIIYIGQQKFNKFDTFYNYGENGYSLLGHDKNNLWMTSTSYDTNSFDVLFNHVSVRLTEFGLCTPSRPGFEKYMPTDFYLFGYSTHTKRWDVILEHKNSNPLEIMSHYTFKIENECKDNFYRIIKFFTVSGRVALSYIDMYGDVIEETDESPRDVASSGSFSVLYKNMPQIIAHQIPKKFSQGLFRKAQSIFGPTLKNFVDVRLFVGEDTRYFDIWEARRGCYYSKKYNKKKAISFYFPHHIVYIEAFQIKPDIYPGLENFAIVGYKNNDDRGSILAYKTDYEMENTDGYYSCETGYQKTGFRIIRFFGLDDYYSFKSLDFLGIAKPTGNVLTEVEMSSSYYIPSVVTKY